MHPNQDPIESTDRTPHRASGEAPDPAATAAERFPNDADDPAPVSASANPGNGAPPDLASALVEAEARAKTNYDDYLRARADVENVRRRAQEDVSKAHKFGIESFADALLPVMDSLDAALADATSDRAKLSEGVELTRKQLASAFARHRLMEIDPTGAKFDPHRHQAVANVPAPEGVPTGHVVTVLQKGWSIAERVLRPAMVTVAS